MTTEIPFACNLNALTPTQREAHGKTTAELFAAVERVEALSNGYAFRLPPDSASLQCATDFIANERLCCPFFEFGVVVEPNGGPIWLRLTGADGIGIKPFIVAEMNIDLSGSE